MAVSVEKWRLFFAHYGDGRASIESCRLDGSNRQLLIARDILRPSSLVIDDVNGRFYWTDEQIGSIENALLNGARDRRIVKKYGFDSAGRLHDRPVKVEIFEDYLLIVGKPNGNVWRLDKFGRQNETHYQHIQLQSPTSLLLLQTVKRAVKSSSLCTNDSCLSSVCVPTVDILPTYKCLCHRGEEFIAGNGCQLIISRNQSLNPSNCGKHLICLNGGECIHSHPSIDPECKCPLGMIGRQCEVDLCHNFCLNGGECKYKMGTTQQFLSQIFTQSNTATRDASMICSCPIEYSGRRCAHFKCSAGNCGAHGQCRIDHMSGLTDCQCDIGWIGERCDRMAEQCDDYCFNQGNCLLSINSSAYCQCNANFYGQRCQNCQSESEIHLQCLNGGYCSPDRNSCQCPKGYWGSKCENDLCKEYCRNGGQCIRSSIDGPTCKCPPGFDGVYCERDACQGFCRNGGICIHKDPEGPFCICPSKFKGSQCGEQQLCSQYCLNDAKCFTSKDSNDWICNCPADLTGDRCETSIKCSRHCLNGAECSMNAEGKPICRCPRGIGGERCDRVNARNCSQLDCEHGICSQLSFPDSAQCLCPIGWSGLACNQAVCFGFCLHGGECTIKNRRPLCSCPDLWMGIRCQLAKVELSDILDVDEDFIGDAYYLIIPILLLIILGSLLSYVVFVRKYRPSRLFKHERMNESQDQEEFQNPVFMHGEEEDPNIVDEATNFTNLMYDVVYNDTVTSISTDTTENHGLLSRLEIRTEET